MSKHNQNSVETKSLLENAWWAGVNAVNGYQLVIKELSKSAIDPVSHVLAIGKAAASMMLGASDFYENQISGLIITKYDHMDEKLRNNNCIQVIESAHPVPDENSLIAGQLAMDFVEALNQRQQLLVLVSGGASALAEKLEGSLNLDDLKAINNQLLSENKAIDEINAQRSRISLIKKGRLLNRCTAKRILTLAISDVQGDDVMVIGSGVGACNLENSSSTVIGSNQVAREAVSDYLTSQSVKVVENREALYGDLHSVRDRIIDMLVNGPKGAYIFGGEPVINLPANPGRGGRNQSLALAMALSLIDRPGISVLVAGSDGTDGPTTAAGGIIDSTTIDDIKAAQQALECADAGQYLESEKALFVTGPTGTNVMDLMVVIKR